MSSFDKAASEAMGAVKVVKAAFKGLKGVFATAMKQHGQATAILKRIHGSSDVEIRRALWPKLRGELVSHEHAEMKVIYPELRNHAETRDLADRHDAEAGELDQLIGKIDAADITGAEWMQLFGELAQTVSQHVAEEEEDFFPKAQATLGDDGAKRLDAPFETAKKREMEKI